MEADAVEALLRDLGPIVKQALVEVLIVSPGHGNLGVHSTIELEISQMLNKHTVHDFIQVTVFGQC